MVLKKTLLFILSPNLKTRVETLTKALAEQQQLNSVKYLKCRAMCPVCVRGGGGGGSNELLCNPITHGGGYKDPGLIQRVIWPRRGQN